MTTTTIITMIVILGFVWGGLALLIATAARREGAKRDAGESGSS